MEEMKIGIKILAVITIFLVVALSGCIDNNLTGGTVHGDAGKFIGAWELEPFEGSDTRDTTTYIFFENGTFISTFNDYDGVPHTGTGDYNLEDGVICMKTHPHGAITDNDSYCYSYIFSIEDKRLTLYNIDLPTVMLVKVE